MKVLHVITDRDRRGAQTFACDLSDAMCKAGHDSRVVAMDGTNEGGLPVASLAGRRWSWSGMIALRKQMKSVDVTVAHGSSTLLACAVAGMGTDAPFVYRQISDSRFWAPRFPARLRVAFSLRRARHVIALSTDAATTLGSYLWLPSGKVSVVPNGVPGKEFQPATPQRRAGARRAAGIPATATVVLYLGALVPEKGVEDAIAGLGSWPAGTVLIVAGDGPLRGALESAAAAKHPVGSVVFTGPVGTPAELYAAADVVVLPSRGGDSMPAVLIEAGLCALPVVSTFVGSIADVVIDGETGCLVAAGDVSGFVAAVGRLLADPHARSEMGAKARSWCLERFEVSAVADRYLEVLAQAAQGRQRQL